MTSLKNMPFTKLGDFSPVIDDDFVHGNIETFKVKGATQNGAKFNWKGKVKCTKKDFSDSTLTDEVNFQFPVNNQIFWFGSRRNGDIKLHADLGEHKVGSKNLTLFANLKTNVQFKKFAFRFGAHHACSKAETAVRFETGVNDSYALTNRTVWNFDDVRVGWAATVSTSKWNLLRYDAFLRYNHKDFNLTVRHESNNLKGEQTTPQLGTVNAFLNINKFSHPVAVQWTNGSQGCCSNGLVTLGTSHQANGWTFKGKVDCGFNVAVSAKKKLSNLATLTVAGKVNVKDPSRALNFENLTPFPLGYQVDFAV